VGPTSTGEGKKWAEPRTAGTGWGGKEGLLSGEGKKQGGPWNQKLAFQINGKKKGGKGGNLTLKVLPRVELPPRRGARDRVQGGKSGRGKGEAGTRREGEKGTGEGAFWWWIGKVRKVGGVGSAPGGKLGKTRVGDERCKLERKSKRGGVGKEESRPLGEIGEKRGGKQPYHHQPVEKKLKKRKKMKKKPTNRKITSATTSPC